MKSRPLVVVGDSTKNVAAMCRAILDAAGLGGTRRKIIGGSAKPPPVVIEGTAAHAFTGEDVVIVTPGARPPTEARLVVSDARLPDPTGTLYGLDTDATTPGWMGALVPTGGGVQPFDLYAGGSYCGRFALREPGEEAVRSAIAAIAACAEGFEIHIETARSALART